MYVCMYVCICKTYLDYINIGIGMYAEVKSTRAHADKALHKKVVALRPAAGYKPTHRPGNLDSLGDHQSETVFVILIPSSMGIPVSPA